MQGSRGRQRSKGERVERVKGKGKGGKGGAVDRVARYHSRKVARRLQGSPACRWWSVRWQGCKSAARSPASNAIFFPLITFKGWGVFTPAERTAKAPTPESPHPTLANFFPKSPFPPRNPSRKTSELLRRIRRKKMSFI